MKNLVRKHVLILFFLSLIFFPLLNSRFKWINDIKSNENRKMATIPEFNFDRLDDFPIKFDKYYSDNFSLRSRLVLFYNNINLNIFKKSPIPNQAIIGKDGWLFMGGDELDCYRGKKSLEPFELESIKLELEYRKKYLEERGCKFYFVIAPTKASVYSEYVPDNIFRLSNESYGEQLISYLNKNSVIRPVNLFYNFRKNKSKQDLYYKLDNHWNQSGALFATNEIFNQLIQDGFNVDEINTKDYKISKKVTSKGNIIEMLSNESNLNDTLLTYIRIPYFKYKLAQKVGYPVDKDFPYPSEFEIVTTTKETSKPKTLIISDSFGLYMMIFSANEFSRTVKIFDSWKYKLNESIVNNEKPDICILLVLESNLRQLLKNQSRPK